MPFASPSSMPGVSAVVVGSTTSFLSASPFVGDEEELQVEVQGQIGMQGMNLRNDGHGIPRAFLRMMEEDPVCYAPDYELSAEEEARFPIMTTMCSARTLVKQ
nr:hypothetical protein Iba_chr10fCG1960 [Ipomoea batatas]